LMLPEVFVLGLLDGRREHEVEYICRPWRTRCRFPSRNASVRAASRTYFCSLPDWLSQAPVANSGKTVAATIYSSVVT
jgi:hypothetical protein